MVHNELAAGSEVRPVELIRHIPTNSAKLLSLLHDVMKEGHAVQEIRPGRMVRVIQGVLSVCQQISVSRQNISLQKNEEKI